MVTDVIVSGINDRMHPSMAKKGCLGPHLIAAAKEITKPKKGYNPAVEEIVVGYCGK